jgi:hypothetical protein
MSGFPGSVRLKLWRRTVIAVVAALALLAVTIDAIAAELYGVVTSGGQPQPGIAVELLSGQGTVAAATTTRQGTYRFRNIPPGSYRLKAAGEQRDVNVGPGVNRFNFAK